MDLTGFIVALFLLLTAAVLVGELLTRLGQAALVGQLAVGIIFGPTLLGPYLGLTSSDPAITGIQFLATFFILVMAGLDINPTEIYRTGFSAMFLGLAVFVGPFLLGALVVPLVYPGISYSTALFVSLTLSITALPVMAVMMAEFRIAKTRMGTLLMNTAVVNELAAVTVFSVLLRLTRSGSSGIVSVAIASTAVALFLTAVFSVHLLLRALRESPLWTKLRRQFLLTWKSKEAGFALLMVMALAAALFSQFLGLTFLIGAFYAGLLITPQSVGGRVHRSIRQIFDAMTWGFFIPLFFAFVGLAMNLRVLASTPATILAFVLLAAFAVLAKLGFGSAVARLLHWERREATAIGFFVSSRGAVELAMAVILLQNGVFSTTVFTIVAAVGVVTTIVAPIGASLFGSLPQGATRISEIVAHGKLSEDDEVEANGPHPSRTQKALPEP